MQLKTILTEFVTVFVVTFVAAVIVTFLYSLIVHGAGQVDWGTAFELGVIFGIVFLWLDARKSKKEA